MNTTATFSQSLFAKSNLIQFRFQIWIIGFIMIAHNGFSQTLPPDNLGISMDSVSDFEGKSHSLRDIQILNTAAPNWCDVGFFHIEFTDNTGTGFNNTANGLALRNVVCQVFQDLSQLIIPANNPYTNVSNQNVRLVNIKIYSTKSSILVTNLAEGGPFTAFIATSTTKNGILDGEVYNTINGGFDSYAIRQMEYTNTFFHGEIAYNFRDFLISSFHTDLTIPSLPTMRDLYQLTLHEAFHCLGFGSLIRVIGTNIQSKITAPFLGPGQVQFFSRFDTHLFGNGNALIANSNSCGNVIHTTILADITAGCANVRYIGSAGNLPIHAPSPYNGASLSHLDETCLPSAPYIMNSQISLTVLKRQPTQDEVNILCDLGYKTTNQYGTNAALL